MKSYLRLTLTLLPFVFCAHSFGSDCSSLARKLTISNDMESGVRDSVKAIDGIIEKLKQRNAVFVVVYGFPGSGKSTLIEKLESHYRSKGLNVLATGGFAPRIETYKDLITLDADSGQSPSFLVLFHVTAPRGLSDPFAVNSVDPNIGLQTHLGHPADLNIGVYRDNRSSINHGPYDLIVENYPE